MEARAQATNNISCPRGELRDVEDEPPVHAHDEMVCPLHHHDLVGVRAIGVAAFEEGAGRDAKPQGGLGFAYERTLVPRWLELEVSMNALFSEAGPVLPVDIPHDQRIEEAVVGDHHREVPALLLLGQLHVVEDLVYESVAVGLKLVLREPVPPFAGHRGDGLADRDLVSQLKREVRT